MTAHATRRPAPRTTAAILTLTAVLLAVAPAAGAVRFGAHDVPTVFYVAKSDDRNRVDYGVRLDSRCRPRTDSPVYAYWRRFEPGEPRFGELNMLDRQAYGVASQTIAASGPGGTWIELRIRAVPDRLLVLTRPGPDGCTARVRAVVDERPAWLDHVFVQLGGLMSIDHVVIHAEDVETGEPVRERRRP